jgi:hypothetical protein
VTAAVAREIVLELDIEQPVHALDAPVTARSVSEPVDIERGRRKKRVSNVQRSAYSTREKTLTRVFMLVKRGSPGQLLAETIQSTFAICDRCAGQKQQHFRQREGNPPGLPTILDLRELIEENGQA